MTDRNKLAGDEFDTRDVLARMLVDDHPAPSWHDRYVKPLGSAYPREQWQWAREYPTLAKFLSEGVPLALMGLRPSAASMPRPAPKEWPAQAALSEQGRHERPHRAALKYGDEVFEGTTHGDAWRSLVDKHGDSPALERAVLDNPTAHGFTTTSGRFISREEAMRLLDVEGVAPRRRPLDSTDLRAVAGPAIMGPALVNALSGERSND